MGELGQPHRQPAAGGYRLRRLPFRGGAAPQHLCRPRRQTLRHRGRLLLQIRWLYRGSVRLGHPAAGNRLRRSLAALAGQPQQWHQLSHPAGRGGRPFPHRTAAAAKGPCPLPAECRHHAANVSQAGAHLCRPPSRLPGPLPLGSAVRMARMPKTAGPGSTACWRAAVFSAPRGPALGRWARAGCGLPPSPDRRTPPRLCGGWNTFCGRPALYYAR